MHNKLIPKTYFFFQKQRHQSHSQCIHSLIFKETKSICENTGYNSPVEKEHSAQRCSPKLKI